jgi:endoglucanase
MLGHIARRRSSVSVGSAVMTSLGLMPALVLAVVTAGCLLPPSRMSAAAASEDDGTDSPHNLIANGSFEDGTSLPWTSSFTAPAEGEATVVDGALCLDIRNAGSNRWDAQLRVREMVIQKGHEYSVRFRAYSDKPTRARPKLGMSGPPYAEYWADTIELDTEPRAFSAKLIMKDKDDPTAELAFHLGAEMASSGAPVRVCVDDVVVEDPEFTRKGSKRAGAKPAIRVNQLGYLPKQQKLAVLVSAADAPVAWELLDASGEVVARGNSEVHGDDPAAGEHVHRIDFSSASAEGAGFVLRAGDAQSHPFAIRAGLYEPLLYDALAFFYHQRVGVEIRMPFAGKKQWTRPAGHTGDKSVPCAPSAGCDYKLDASGGWYDAGDHGKYVVNAGISVWTLLDLYERSARSDDAALLADGRLRIPEAGNKLPDLLDETRVELEWMLRMQVPEGKPRAGMAHHKLHGNAWTELGTRPHEDRVPRFLYAPSTAATLNLAAVAAQASRIFAPFDPAFSKRCLVAAERAWKAALAHPAVYAPDKVPPGGGPYGDSDVRDEQYWAAAELLVTTGKPEYRQALERSSWHLRVPTTLGGSAADKGQTAVLDWQNVGVAGTISLAVAGDDGKLGDLPKKARAAITSAADELLALREREGYRIPFRGGPDGYPWGSNSFMLNNALVLGLAHDFTKDGKYVAGVISTLDYVLGENALDQSYVTGYGARPLRNPHHRFFARQIRDDRPEPPPGIVSGGPNSGVQDPYARAAGLEGKPAQQCFIDHIESWSTNEITINWNAPLAWVAAFVSGLD